MVGNRVPVLGLSRQAGEAQTTLVSRKDHSVDVGAPDTGSRRSSRLADDSQLESCCIIKHLESPLRLQSTTAGCWLKLVYAPTEGGLQTDEALPVVVFGDAALRLKRTTILPFLTNVIPRLNEFFLVYIKCFL